MGRVGLGDIHEKTPMKETCGGAPNVSKETCNYEKRRMRETCTYETRGPLWC